MSRSRALRLVDTREMAREKWLEVRKRGIGSSDAAAAVGLCPYKSQLELWMEKTGRAVQKEEPDQDSPMYWGTLLEPYVASAYTEKTGIKVRRLNAVLQHPNGKRLPEKDDQFTLTSQVQNREGWVLHPLDEALRNGAGGKLRSIPVRLLFNDPALNLRADYSLFDRSTGRPVCVGNGETARRFNKEGMTQETCPGPDGCPFAKGECKAYARLNVRIGDDDELGSFVLRTTSYNTIRTLTARLAYFGAVSGDRLSCIPLELKLRGKSTTMSYRAAIYYVDLVIRSDMTLEEAVSEARRLDQVRKEAGLDQAALDEAARQGFANGAFEDLAEDVPAVVEEFYPDEGAASTADGKGNRAVQSNLRNRLQGKVALVSGQQSVER